MQDSGTEAGPEYGFWSCIRASVLQTALRADTERAAGCKPRDTAPND